MNDETLLRDIADWIAIDGSDSIGQLLIRCRNELSYVPPREPTDAMLTAAMGVAPTMRLLGRAVWLAMYDAALKTGGTK